MSRKNQLDNYRVIADFYDFVPPYVQRTDVAFYVNMAKKTGGPILELGCGTGRITIPTAKGGLEITGLDVSQAMLDVAAEKLSRHPAAVQKRVTWQHGDMTQFHLQENFRLVTIPFHAFQHVLTVTDQLACLECVHRHLKDNGLLIVDAFNPRLPYLIDDQYLEEWGDESEFTMPDGRRIYRRSRTISRDLVRQVLEIDLIHYITHPDGRKERLPERIFMRYFFRYELEHLLVRAGFNVEAVYGDYEMRPFGEIASGEIIMVARK